MEKNHSFKVGDLATYTVHTDSRAGWVAKVSKNGKTVLFQEWKATLLNPPGSEAADALKFSPGGFVGHTSGSQRWQIERDESAVLQKFTLRSSGFWKAAGHRTLSPGCCLTVGHSHHYDFNF